MAAKVDIGEAVALHQSGKTTREIAAHFGVQSPAITRALNKAGIRLRKGGGFSAFRRHELADLVAGGAGFREAAAAMGVGLPHVKKLWATICADLGWQAV